MLDTSNQWRIGGACGVFFVILFLVGAIFIAGEPPSIDSPAGEIQQYWVDNGEQYLLGDWLSGIGFIFGLIPFAVVLRSLLGRAEGGAEVCSRIALVALVLAMAVAAAASVGWGALAMGAETMDEGAVEALMYVDAYGFNIFGLLLGLFVASASVVIWSTGVLWRWLAVVGGIVLAGHVAGSLDVVNGEIEDGVLWIFSVVGFVGTLIWILGASVGLLMHGQEPVTAGSEPATS